VAVLERSARIDSTDRDVLQALAEQFQRLGERARADSVRRRIAALPAHDAVPVGAFSEPSPEGTTP
jgi:hypothetical protein